MSPAREEIFEIDLSLPRGQERWHPLRRLRLLALGTKVEPPGATFGPRHQYSWLLVWVRVGTVRFKVDRTLYQGEPGTVLLVRPGAVDSHDWSDRERSAHSFIHFDFQPPAKGWPPARDWPVTRSFPEAHPMLALFESVVSMPRTADSAWAPLVLPMIELILRFHVATEPTHYAREHLALPDLVARGIGIMHRHTEEKAAVPLTLGELASALHVSPPHLCRVFRRHLGMGPMKCAQMMRLDKVVRLLERTELLVKEIADRTGFGNAFHLSAAFRSAFGISPSAYRDRRARGLQPRNFAPALRQLPGQQILIDMPAMRRHMARWRRHAESPAELDGERMSRGRRRRRPRAS